MFDGTLPGMARPQHVGSEPGGGGRHTSPLERADVTLRSVHMMLGGRISGTPTLCIFLTLQPTGLNHLLAPFLEPGDSKECESHGATEKEPENVGMRESRSGFMELGLQHAEATELWDSWAMGPRR